MCYHRIIFAISFFNLIANIWFWIGDLAHMPVFDTLRWGSKENPSVINNRGSITTCQMSGFSIYMGTLAIPWYSAALIIYYYLAVRRGWKEDRLRRNFERYVHMTIVPISLIAAIIPLFFDLYDIFYTYCFVVQVDPNGDYLVSDIMQMLTLLSVILSTFIMALCIMFLISFRYSETIRESQELSRISTGLKMAIPFSASFIFSWALPVSYIGNCVITLRQGVYFGIPQSRTAINIIFMYLAICLPLQGILNLIIYLLPRYQKLREESGSAFVIMKTLCWSCNKSDTSSYNEDCYLGSCMTDTGTLSTDGVIERCESYSTDLRFNKGTNESEMELRDLDSRSQLWSLPPVITVPEDKCSDCDVKSELSVDHQIYTIDGFQDNWFNTLDVKR